MWDFNVMFYIITKKQIMKKSALFIGIDVSEQIKMLRKKKKIKNNLN